MPSFKNPSSQGSEKPEPLTNHSRPSSVATDLPPDDAFKLGRRGALVFFTLAVLTLMAALDGTSLSVALPVCVSMLVSVSRCKLMVLDYLRKIKWNCN